MNYSISISTYFTDKILQRGRLEIFKKSINSLLDSGFEGKIFIVDDGSQNKSHLDYINSLKNNNIFLILKNENVGLSRVKNTGIKSILESGSLYGFLADDDILYKPNWFYPYLDVMENTNVKHLAFFNESWTPDIPVNKNKTVIKFDKYNFNLYNVVQGGLLTFTKDMIDTIGYYKVLPYKIGHEHSNFSNRAILGGFTPGFLDISDSNNLLSYVDNSGMITTRDEDFREKCSINMNNLFSSNYEPCIE